MNKTKLLAILLSVMLVFSCTAVLAEAATDDTVCVYVIYNVTGETVTELYLTDNNTGEQSENFAGEEGLADLGIVEIGGENYDGYAVTLSFKTESGYEAAFETLHFENVPISLLPAPTEDAEAEADAVSGATPISFSVPYYTAFYSLCNQTGERVIGVTYTDNATGDTVEAWGEEDGIDGIEPGEILETYYNWSADTISDNSLTLHFITKSGYEGEFATLHFENVQINLLSPDAMTGATQVSFSMPAAEE